MDLTRSPLPVVSSANSGHLRRYKSEQEVRHQKGDAVRMRNGLVDLGRAVLLGGQLGMIEKIGPLIIIQAIL